MLASWTRASTVRAGLAQRARIVLLAADGVSNTEIAERVGGGAADGDLVADQVRAVRGEGSGR